MKIKIISSIFLFFLFSISAQAQRWADLEIGAITHTSRDATLPRWGLPQGSTMELQDIIGLDYIHVVVYVMKWNECNRGDQIAEVELFSYEQSNREKIEVGLALDNCQVNIFVETKDLMKETFF